MLNLHELSKELFGNYRAATQTSPDPLIATLLSYKVDHKHEFDGSQTLILNDPKHHG